MSHNPTSIIITNKPAPSVTATGGSLINPPYFQFGTGYESVVFDNTVLKFNNFITGFNFMPYNPGVTALSFDDMQAAGTISIPSYIDIANPVALSFPALVYVGNLTWSTYLGTISLPALKYALSLNFSSVSISSIGLTSLNLPELLYVNTFNFQPSSAINFTSFTAPKLKKAYNNFIFTSSAVTSLNLPELTNTGNLTITQNSLLTTLSFPVLVSAIAISIYSNVLLPSITFPSLVYCTSFSISSGTSPALTSISLPALRTINSMIPTQTTPVIITNAANLTSFSFPNLLSLGTTGNFTISGAALTQATVDAILVKIASLNGTGGTTAFSNRTVTLNGGTSSTPSATGLAAKATLVARGCTVTNN